MGKSNKCMICDNNIRVISNITREGSCNVFKCNSCEFVFLDNNTSLPNYTDSYRSQIYANNWSLEESMVKRCDSLKKSIDKIDIILKTNSLQTILEIGSGVGACIYGLKKRKSYNIDAVEPNVEYQRWLGKCFKGVKIYSDISQINQKYDLIFGLHVFEHLRNPYEYLRSLSTISRKKTRLYLEFPNYDDFYKCTLKDGPLENYSKFMFHNAHPYYYSIKSFKKLIEKTEWEIVHIETIQEYSILNYFNWFFLGTPMKDIEEATIITEDLNELNGLFQKMIEKKHNGNSISCILKLRNES